MCGPGVPGKSWGCGWLKLGRRLLPQGPCLWPGLFQGNLKQKTQGEKDCFSSLAGPFWELLAAGMAGPGGTWLRSHSLPTRQPLGSTPLEEASGPTTFTVDRTPHPLSPCTGWPVKRLPRPSLSWGIVRGWEGELRACWAALAIWSPSLGAGGGREVINASLTLSPSLLRSQSSEVWAY